MARRGKSVESHWISRSVQPPTPEEVMALGLGAGDRVARLERVRRSDGVPLAIERGSIPTQVLPDPEVVGTSLYAVLERSGQRPVRAVQRISAVDGGILAPGFLDLQVNGAGGRMVDGSCTADWLAEMCAIHARLGATGILPTLITDTPEATAAVIADGIRVAPAALRIAMATSDRLFLVSDAMAAAGSNLTEFTLGGRRILRRDGRLTLEDGTLAGADLTLPQAVGVLLGLCTPAEVALAMATSRPADCLGRGAELGHLLPGRPADMVHLGPQGQLLGVWRGGEPLAMEKATVAR